jgi:hypothetical protein
MSTNVDNLDEDVIAMYRKKMNDLIQGLYPLGKASTRLQFAQLERWVGHDLFTDTIFLRSSRTRSPKDPERMFSNHIPKLQWEEYERKEEKKGITIPELGAEFTKYQIPSKRQQRSIPPPPPPKAVTPPPKRRKQVKAPPKEYETVEVLQVTEHSSVQEQLAALQFEFLQNCQVLISQNKSGGSEEEKDETKQKSQAVARKPVAEVKMEETAKGRSPEKTRRSCRDLVEREKTGQEKEDMEKKPHAKATSKGATPQKKRRAENDETKSKKRKKEVAVSPAVMKRKPSTESKVQLLEEAPEKAQGVVVHWGRAVTGLAT